MLIVGAQGCAAMTWVTDDSCAGLRRVDVDDGHDVAGASALMPSSF